MEFFFATRYTHLTMIALNIDGNISPVEAFVRRGRRRGKKRRCREKIQAGTVKTPAFRFTVYPI